MMRSTASCSFEFAVEFLIVTENTTKLAIVSIGRQWPPAQALFSRKVIDVYYMDPVSYTHLDVYKRQMYNREL